MGVFWINNCLKEFRSFICKLENMVKTSLELKSQFSELEYKIVQETKKQVSSKRNNNAKQSNFSLSSVKDISSEVFGDEITADQTKAFNCDQSIIAKESHLTKFSVFENSKFMGSNEDLKSYTKKKETEVYFTCYNEFSSKDEFHENKEAKSGKHKKSIKESIEKTNEKFMISLKETKFETLANIANVRLFSINN